MRKIFEIAAAGLCLAACANTSDMGTYGSDAEFFEKNGIETVELKDGDARVLLVPAWQGRVMTSTTGGSKGPSFGWINRKFIESGEVSPQFNSYGGEERFWLGPEGGPFSWYFAKGAVQEYSNWKVPAVIDTEAFSLDSSSDVSAVLSRNVDLKNASGNEFSMGLRREVTLLSGDELSETLGCEIPEGLSSVAYRTDNSITNLGDSAWTRQTGMPSVWLLGCFNPTPTTTVFIPYNEEYEGKKVNVEYFGTVPGARLAVEDGFAFFRIDGKFRSKIGLPAGSAKGLVGSYDSASGTLNILVYKAPEGPCDYVNGQWGPQEDPFNGDVVNAYNDGPTDTGVLMGPFYETETSPPAASLLPGETLVHSQTTVHIQGPQEVLSTIALSVFGIDLTHLAESREF